jgi:hypothetical protein
VNEGYFGQNNPSKYETIKTKTVLFTLLQYCILNEIWVFTLILTQGEFQSGRNRALFSV